MAVEGDRLMDVKAGSSQGPLVDSQDDTRSAVAGLSSLLVQLMQHR